MNKHFNWNEQNLEIIHAQFEVTVFSEIYGYEKKTNCNSTITHLVLTEAVILFSFFFIVGII